MPENKHTHYNGVGELLIALFGAYNIDTVFGIPGVHTVEMYRGLAESPIRHITPRHEQGAGFMADGYARVTGKPGVCLCITGPGMTNIATAMGQAYADSIPMLVISSVNKSTTLGLGLGQLHELTDQKKLVSTVSAFSHTLLSVNELPDVFARAFAVFNSARPRPVHIEIPIDVLTQTVTLNNTLRIPTFSKPGPCHESITRAATLIANAERTVLLAGGGCINAASELLQFVELTGSPCCLTINARGLIPPDHPLLLDGVQTVNAFHDVVDQSDLVIAIGTELGETDYDFYGTGGLPTNGKLLRIDIDPLQGAASGGCIEFIHADAKAALAALNNALQIAPQIVKQANAANDVERINEALKQQCSAPTQQYDALFSAILGACPDAIIVGDSTKPIYHGNFVFRAKAPRRWFNSATGFGTLGYALPAAIGAKLGKPDSAVIAIAGDGGFQFTANELVSAAQAQTAIAIIVWNNNGYREIRDFMTSTDVSPIGVDVLGPNLALLAEAMHARYVRAHSLNDIGSALADLHTLNTAMLIEFETQTDA